MTFAAIVNERALMAVGQAMRDHTNDFITPISRALEHTYGVVEGSGTFLALRGMPYLLTNEHVARARLEHVLAHFVGNGLLAARIIHPFQCITQPTDAALARIDRDILEQGTKRTIPSSRIDELFDPVEGEIMFIHGFPGVQSHFSATFGGLLTRTFPYATDIAQLSPSFDTDLHFGLCYPPYGDVMTFEGQPASLPDPSGLSGTIVWNTRFVEIGGSWTPDHATVCGIIHQWNQTDHCLVATRIEILRLFLLKALQQEAAYFHWLERDCPLWQEMVDWSWVERQIMSID